MKILFLDKIFPELKKNLISEGLICIDNFVEKKEKIQQIIHKYDGIVIRSRFKIDKQFIEKAKKLKFIARFGSGMENIDVSEAKKNKIKCLNAPSGNSNAVGEHTLALLLSVMNNIQKSNQEIINGKWIREKNRGVELSKKIVGIIGYGNAGRAFTEKLIGFQCKILAYDKYKNNFQSKYVKESSMVDIFKNADILSIHIPLNNETKYLIDDSFFNTFSKKIFFLNTSRGQIVNTKDLVKNIKSGKIIGAGLDVLEFENKSFENLNITNNKYIDFLKQSPNVIMTPHIAGWSFESNKLMCQILTKKILFHLKSIE